ncbi:MAG: AtpZ/AtpI family protein [candidate division Zixibacteria bacterium]|nr:AtpZ/AtpI family protein [candidate division Zixibacteria bacterium]
MNKKSDEKYSMYRQLGIFTTIPIILAVGPILGYFIGNFLDEKLHTEPYLMIVFIFFGFVAAGRGVYNLVKRASEEDKK